MYSTILSTDCESRRSSLTPSRLKFGAHQISHQLTLRLKNSYIDFCMPNFVSHHETAPSFACLLHELT